MVKVYKCSHSNYNSLLICIFPLVIEKKMKMMTTENDKKELVQSRLNKIKSSKVFEILIIAVIVISAIAVGAHSYSLAPQTIKILAILEYIISAIFIMEIGIRILAEEKYSDFFRSGWNMFDFTIVAISLIPIGNAQVVWVARIVRIFRVLRLIAYVPQLRITIDTLGRAIPRIGYVCLLMFILFYMYGTLGNMFFGKINPFLWGNVSISMLTLFRVLTLEDWTDVMYETMEVHSLSWIYYLSFIFLVAFIFLNIMVAIVIDAWQEGRIDQEKNIQSVDDLLKHEPIDSRFTTLENRIKQIENSLLQLKIDKKILRQ
jgi:voltage-gated sodium channel